MKTPLYVITPRNSRSDLEDIVEALRCGGELKDMAAFFENAGLQRISRHLKKACAEIDDAWQRWEERSKPQGRHN